MRAGDTPRIKRAIAALNGRLEFILDAYETITFVDILGKVGGNFISYRVYNDGKITER